MEKVFVDKNIKITTGEAASKLLEEKDTMAFFEDNIGTRKTSIKKWNEAQEYESKTWLQVARSMNNDRNDDHEREFGGYSNLNQYFQKDKLNIIELGCGPFTNLKLIFNKLKKHTNNVHLLDPLINNYMLYQPNCTYKNGLLNLKNVKTFNTPIEKFDNKITYDLVVMINVLEHCYNVDLIFEKVFNMLEPGGILLFNDVYINDEFVRDYNLNKYDTGHPIKLSKFYFDNKINDYKILNENVFETDEYRGNMYYILQK